MTTFIKYMNPKIILHLLQNIDKETIQASKAHQVPTWHIWTLLLITSLSLLIIHYLKFQSSFYVAISLAENIFDISNQSWLRAIRSHPFSELFAHIWWASWHYLFFLIVPILTIRLIFKQTIAEYGWQKGTVFSHWKMYVFIILFLICFMSFISFNSSFSNFYPFYKLAHRSWFDLIAWEVLYLLQFVALEFFFRGFLLQGLKIPFGSLSIGIMCIPYMMIHFPKLGLEAGGALIFGFFLGIIALRSRSIWGGVSIHIAVALTLDIAALLQTKGLPKIFFPVY